MNYQTRATEPQSAIPNPQSAIACAATTRDGAPCHAHPVPGSDFCPFHHPDNAAAVAEGRSKGGAAPRRVRRVPLVLDHVHVAALMSELLVEAVNHPEAVDPKRLHAVTNLSRALLKAVGVPQGSYYMHFDRRETPAEFPHLRRLLPTPEPLPADLPEPAPEPTASHDVWRLLELPEEETSDPALEGLSDRDSKTSHKGRQFLLADSSLLDWDAARESYARAQAAAAAAQAPEPEPAPSAPAAPAEPADLAAAETPFEETPAELQQRQALDRCWTGDPGTEDPSCEEMRGDDTSFEDAAVPDSAISRRTSSRWLDPPLAPLPRPSIAERPVLLPLRPFRGVEPSVGYLKE
jgi:hypothetical protein